MTTEATSYVLGHRDAELRWLATQARLTDSITRRFLTGAGLGDGMRVLDVGSGAGDTAMLTAAMVGRPAKWSARTPPRR